MIKTTRQLKDKVHNMSGGDSKKAQTLIRNYIMEEFLLRLSLSKHKDKFILKGGMLVSSLAGLSSRATMDIDTTVTSLTLTMNEATLAIEEICAVPIDDSISFRIIKASDIMEENDYPGIRFMLEAKFDTLIQSIKIDISTGDVITPAAIEYSYKMMFEEQTINIISYNVETLLAEKLETIVSRGITNTRMRDFYDIYIITENNNYNAQIFKAAFDATALKRKTYELIPDIDEILKSIHSNRNMASLWDNYSANSYYINDVQWDTVCNSVFKLASQI